MKKTDLEKLKGLKIQSRMKNSGTPERFAKGSGAGNADAAVNPLVAKLLRKGLAGKDPA